MSTITLPADTAADTLSQAADAAEDGLFDSNPYQLPTPRLDGTHADKLQLAFTGTIDLDPHDDADLQLIRRLQLDADVTLHVEAAIAGKAFKVKRTEEETTATHTITAKVHTLYRDTP